MTNSISEIGDAACILAIGTNTTQAHPVLALEVVRAAKSGKKLIVANPREIPLCKFASIWLRQKPGTDVPLLMGMMKVILDERLADESFIKERTEDFEAFKESLKPFDLDYVEKITGVPREKIIEAARLYAMSRPASILYTMGITQHSHGTDNVMALGNLAMLTGNIGKPSSGVNPLRGQNNVQGACDMGALPNVYTGYQKVDDPAVKKKFEDAWGVPLISKPGLPVTETFHHVLDGQVKAIYIVGENPVLTEAAAGHVEEALKKLDFLVVQDIFMTETARLAHVVLPATSFAEKDGSFTNSERRVQRVNKVIEPVGNSRPDWLIISQLARKMGAKGFDYQSPSDIMKEIATLTPSYGGISLERLEKESVQWPCPTPEHPGTPTLHVGKFARGKGKFAPLKYRPSAETADENFPLILTTGRSLYQYHTGTMTRKTAGLTKLSGLERVEVNPADAAKYHLVEGEVVKVTSRRGQVKAMVKVTEASPVGVVFMTFHFAETPTNLLTNPALDPVAKIPEFKVAAVRIEKDRVPEPALT